MIQLDDCTASIAWVSAGLWGGLALAAAEEEVVAALEAAEGHRARVFPSLLVILEACAIEALPARLRRFILGFRDRYGCGEKELND